ncbi:MAG: FAD:protein transferase [Solirubrobacteraceae bacterium]|jgi:thiamine biosynthesis lipoprotein|nr:FAD:protein transferase [Solirubrobacteraceae bacterium]
MVDVREVMGTVVSVDLRDAGSASTTAAEEVFGWLHDVDTRFTTFSDDSELRRFDQGRLTLAECSADLADVLECCEALRAETGGAFDPRARGTLDPSAFVKGWAVERAAHLLETSGIRRYCLNAGGDVRVGAGPENGAHWQVGIRHPHSVDQIAAVVGVLHAAVATSGAYERGTHILDPRTRRPPLGVLSTTVVGPDLGLADAYSTAAFAMGREGIGWIAGLPHYAGLAIHDDATTLSTPAFDALRTA